MPAGQAAGAMGSQRNANMAGVQNNLKNNQQMQAGAKPQMQRGNGSQFLQNNNSMQQRSLINERVSLKMKKLKLIYTYLWSYFFCFFKDTKWITASAQSRPSKYGRQTGEP